MVVKSGEGERTLALAILFREGDLVRDLCSIRVVGHSGIEGVSRISRSSPDFSAMEVEIMSCSEICILFGGLLNAVKLVNIGDPDDSTDVERST